MHFTFSGDLSTEWLMTLRSPSQDKNTLTLTRIPLRQGSGQPSGMGEGIGFGFLTLARFAGEGRVRVPMSSRARNFKGANMIEVHFSTSFGA